MNFSSPILGFDQEIGSTLNRILGQVWKFALRLLLSKAPSKFNSSIELNYIPTKYIESLQTLNSALFQEFKACDADYFYLSQNFDAKKIFLIKNAIVDTKLGSVFIQDGNQKYIHLEMSSEWPKEKALSQTSIVPKKSIGTIAQGSLGLPSINYYHLTTHWLANSIELSKKSYPAILSPFSHSLASEISSFYKLPVQITPHRWVRVEKLAMINLGQIGYLHPYDLKVISSEKGKIQSAERKIYVSRINSSRSIPGEEILERKLFELGFQIIRAEDLSYENQVNIFSTAELIVGPHGAGLVNAVYAVRAKILELMPANRINRCIEWQSKVCGHGYERIIYEASEKPSSLIARVLQIVNSYD